MMHGEIHKRSPSREAAILAVETGHREVLE